LKCYDRWVTSAPGGPSLRLPRGTRRGGPAGVLGGLALLVVGTGLALYGLNADGHPENRPMGLSMGGAFALVGVLVLIQSVGGWLDAARRRRALAAWPGEPWLADHAWRREGIVDDTAGQARSALVGGGLLTLLASVLASVMMRGAEGPGLFILVVILGVLMAFGLGLLGRGVYLVLRRARHGLAEVRFGRFPFFLGGPLEVELLREPNAPRLPRLTARLACVVERWVEREVPSSTDDARQGKATRVLEREEVWHAVQAVAPGPGPRIPLRFELPPPGGAAVATALSEDPPRYWELSLHADLPGVDFGATFLVPVYERVRAAPPATDPPAPPPAPSR
jgi:hypothetical protein